MKQKFLAILFTLTWLSGCLSPAMAQTPSLKKKFVTDTILTSDTTKCTGCTNENSVVGLISNVGGNPVYKQMKLAGSSDTVASTEYVRSNGGGGGITQIKAKNGLKINGTDTVLVDSMGKAVMDSIKLRAGTASKLACIDANKWFKTDTATCNPFLRGQLDYIIDTTKYQRKYNAIKTSDTSVFSRKYNAVVKNPDNNDNKIISNGNYTGLLIQQAWNQASAGILDVFDSTGLPLLDITPTGRINYNYAYLDGPSDAIPGAFHSQELYSMGQVGSGNSPAALDADGKIIRTGNQIGTFIFDIGDAETCDLGTLDDSVTMVLIKGENTACRADQGGNITVTLPASGPSRTITIKYMGGQATGINYNTASFNTKENPPINFYPIDVYINSTYYNFRSGWVGGNRTRLNGPNAYGVFNYSAEFDNTTLVTRGIPTGKGSVSDTLTGVDGTVGNALTYEFIGNHVSLTIPGIFGTTTSNAATVIGLPSRFYPQETKTFYCSACMIDGTSYWPGVITIGTDGVITLAISKVLGNLPSLTGWTSTIVTKGFTDLQLEYSREELEDPFDPDY